MIWKSQGKGFNTSEQIFIVVIPFYLLKGFFSAASLNAFFSLAFPRSPISFDREYAYHSPISTTRTDLVSVGRVFFVYDAQYLSTLIFRENPWLRQYYRKNNTFSGKKIPWEFSCSLQFLVRVPRLTGNMFLIAQFTIVITELRP